jgi:hypothetical protein
VGEGLPPAELGDRLWANERLREGSVVFDTLASQFKVTSTCTAGAEPGFVRVKFDEPSLKTFVQIPDLKTPDSVNLELYRFGEPLENHQLYYDKDVTGPLTAAQVCAWLEAETATAAAAASGGGGGGGAPAAAQASRQVHATALTPEMAARAEALIRGEARTRFIPCIGREKSDRPDEDGCLCERPYALAEPVSCEKDKLWVYLLDGEGEATAPGGMPDVSEYLIFNPRWVTSGGEWATYQAMHIKTPPRGSPERTNATVCEAVWNALSRFMSPSFRATKSAQDPPYEVFVCSGPPAAGAVAHGVNPGTKRGNLLTHFGPGVPLRHNAEPFTKDASNCTLRVVVTKGCDGADNVHFPRYKAEGKMIEAWAQSSSAPAFGLFPLSGTVPLLEVLHNSLGTVKPNTVSRGCMKCGNDAHTAVTSLWRAPPMMIFTLKRFQVSEEGALLAMQEGRPPPQAIKNNTNVTFPIRGLDLGAFVEPGQLPGVLARSVPPPALCEPDAVGCGDNLLYDLFGVVEHAGVNKWVRPPPPPPARFFHRAKTNHRPTPPHTHAHTLQRRALHGLRARPHNGGVVGRQRREDDALGKARARRQHKGLHSVLPPPRHGEQGCAGSERACGSDFALALPRSSRRARAARGSECCPPRSSRRAHVKRKEWKTHKHKTLFPP